MKVTTGLAPPHRMRVFPRPPLSPLPLLVELLLPFIKMHLAEKRRCGLAMFIMRCGDGWRQYVLGASLLIPKAAAFVADCVLSLNSSCLAGLVSCLAGIMSLLMGAVYQSKYQEAIVLSVCFFKLKFHGSRDCHLSCARSASCQRCGHISAPCFHRRSQALMAIGTNV